MFYLKLRFAKKKLVQKHKQLFINRLIALCLQNTFCLIYVIIFLCV